MAAPDAPAVLLRLLGPGPFAELEAKAAGRPLQDAAVQEGFASRSLVLAALADAWGMKVARPDELGGSCPEVLPEAFWREHAVIPLGVDGRTLKVAFAGLDHFAQDDIALRTGLAVEACLALPCEVESWRAHRADGLPKCDEPSGYERNWSWLEGVIKRAVAAEAGSVDLRLRPTRIVAEYRFREAAPFEYGFEALLARLKEPRTLEVVVAGKARRVTVLCEADAQAAVLRFRPAE